MSEREWLEGLRPEDQEAMSAEQGDVAAIRDALEADYPQPRYALAALDRLAAALERAERELVDVEMDRRFQQDRARTAERERDEERERFHRHVETLIEPQLLARVEKAERALAEVRARLQKLNVTQMDDHDAALVRAALRSSEEVSDES